MVNLSFHLPRIALPSMAIALALLLGACGQRGPLYLPSKPAADLPAGPTQAPPAPASPTTPSK